MLPLTGAGPSSSAAFIPTDISGLELWLDFSDISTLFQDSGKGTPVTSDGDVIGAAEDKSGNGNDALQVTTANKPLYKTPGLDLSRSGRFDGTNDTMQIANYSFAGNTVTLFIKTSSAEWIASRKLFGRSVDPTRYLFYQMVADKLAIYDGAGVSSFGAVPAANTAVVIAYVLNNTSIKCYVDGVQSGAEETVAAIDWSNSGELYVAGNETGGDNSPADFEAVLLYDSALSDLDRNLVEAYLA